MVINHALGHSVMSERGLDALGADDVFLVVSAIGTSFTTSVGHCKTR
jgi:hypothetical protein